MADPHTPSAWAILVGARDVLADPAAWTTGTVARDSQGRPTAVHADDAVSWCLASAVTLAAGDGSVSRARDCLDAVLDGHNVSGHNDYPGRTHADILDTLARAIAIASPPAWWVAYERSVAP